MKVRFNVKRYFQVLGLSLAVIIAGAAICMGVDFSSFGETELADNTSIVEAEGGKINVLLMCTDIDGLRTDAIMLAQYDIDSNIVNMLSVPRDTRMYVGNRYQKINAAHAYMTDGKIGGAEATVEAVTRITGIPINYYIDFSLDGVAHVINELGPVEFTVPDICGDGQGMVYDDPVQSLHINLPPGTYGLNGSQSVWLMRFRHGNWDYDMNDGKGGFRGYIDGDGGRMELQQQFIKAVVDQKVNASLVLKIPSIFKAISDEIKTNLTAKDVVKYSKYAAKLTSTNIISHELPGQFDTYFMDGANQDVWEVDLDATRELVRAVFGYMADDITIENPNGPSNGADAAASNGENTGKGDNTDNQSYSDYDTNSGYSKNSGSYSGSNNSYSSYRDYDDNNSYDNTQDVSEANDAGYGSSGSSGGESGGGSDSANYDEDDE